MSLAGTKYLYSGLIFLYNIFIIDVAGEVKMETTMIQVKRNTAEKLKKLKDYERQSYDELINKLIQTSETEMLTEQEISEIKHGLDDIKAGRTRSIEEVAKDLGVRLKG